MPRALSGPGPGPVTKPSTDTEMSATMRVMPGQTRSAARTHRSRIEHVWDANPIAPEQRVPGDSLGSSGGLCGRQEGQALLALGQPTGHQRARRPGVQRLRVLDEPFVVAGIPMCVHDPGEPAFGDPCELRSGRGRE